MNLPKIKDQIQIIYFAYNFVTVLHQNINGLLNKSDMLSICIHELATQNVSVDVICITEHNMTEGDDAYLKISNYRLVSCFMRDSRHGGSGILLKNNIKFKVLNNITKLSISNIIECSAIELVENRIVIMCIYRPPNSNANSITSFFTTLNKILKNISLNGKKIILCGDFNINILKQTRISSEFTELLISYNLKLQVKEITRFASKTCIDNIAHNLKSCKVTTKELALSDHNAQIIKIPVKKTCTVKYWYSIKRNYSENNRALFIKYLKQLTNRDVYRCLDANRAYNQFHENFVMLYDLCFPLTRIKTFNKSRPKWISRGLKICSKRKCHLLWQYRKNPNASNKNAFKTYATRYKKIIRLTKKSQNDYYIKTATNKSKATWDVINEIKYKFPVDSIDQIITNDEIITNPKDIAKTFNDFFLDINNNNNKQFDTLNNPLNKLTYNSNSIFLTPTIPEDINKIIISLKNKNSTGYDGITTAIVKDVADIISEPLSYVINLCVEQGIFPDKLKISIVKPVFKKGDKTNMSNYRPIALLPIFAKILEKVIYKCLYTFLESHNIFSPSQYGFRKNKSINVAIYNFLGKIMTNLDKGLPAVAIYMDMSKAFDRVDHNILLRKLYAYGVRGNAYNLIKSYLSNRQQITEIKKVNIATKTEEIYASNSRTVELGVPQGGILSAPLFLVYINNMPSVVNHDMTLFADDSTVLFTNDITINLESDINKSLILVNDWLNSNKLMINIDKTKIMNFKIRTRRTGTLNIKYQDKDIEETETTKFLGLYVDDKINWKKQVDYVCKKLSKFSYALYRLRKIANLPTLITAYHGHVSCNLRYGLIFWGNSVDKERAFIAQKRCVRAIFNLQKTDSCEPYFKEMNVLTLPCLYIFEVAVFVKNNNNLFKYRMRIRHQDKLDIVPSKTHFLHKSIFCSAPRIFNNIPRPIRAITEMKAFKKKLHELLVNKCYYSMKDFFDDKSLLKYNLPES